MQKKIAIAVDGSLPAAQAVCYATTIAAFIQNLHFVPIHFLSCTKQSATLGQPVNLKFKEVPDGFVVN